MHQPGQSEAGSAPLTALGDSHAAGQRLMNQIKPACVGQAVSGGEGPGRGGRAEGMGWRWPGECTEVLHQERVGLVAAGFQVAAGWKRASTRPAAAMTGADDRATADVQAGRSAPFAAFYRVLQNEIER